MLSPVSDESRRMEPLDSSTLRWRRCLLTVCALGFLLWAFSLFQAAVWYGRVGWYTEPTKVPFHDVVDVVLPGEPAAQAGIKAGDIFDLRRASASARWRFRTRWLADQPFTYVVLHGATQQRITLRPHRWIDLSSWSSYVGSLGALIFAALIAWRRPGLIEARLLCLVLIAQVITDCLEPREWVTLWAGLDFRAVIVGEATRDLVLAMLIAYTLLFGRPVSTMRKAFAAFAFGLLGFDLLFSWAGDVGSWTGAFDLLSSPIGRTYWGSLALYLFVLIAVATAFAAARGRERSLLFWTTATFVIIYLNGVLIDISLSVPRLASNSSLLEALNNIDNIARFLTPLALGYALLHRRLLDIGFALNQAAVFSGVSLIIVGLFMLGEWLIGSWLGRMSHATGVTISAALVLALGFSVRVIHSRVERVLDRAFFRKRHDDEMAILNFAERAADSTDAATLVRETKETLETHADAEFVTLAMDDGKGRFGDVSGSDSAIIALHNRHNALDLKALSTQLRGEFAYPMIARGQLVGALVLGPKRSGENYAPDESHAIMKLAHEVGHALRFLSLEKALQGRHLPA
jgi:hypothetical protein